MSNPSLEGMFRTEKNLRNTEVLVWEVFDAIFELHLIVNGECFCNFSDKEVTCGKKNKTCFRMVSLTACRVEPARRETGGRECVVRSKRNQSLRQK